ncbi:MAG: hypothetical protein QM477_06805 [Planctomycetota bacterium]
MSKSTEIRWRVGTVPYLVARPLTFGLSEDPRIELIEAPPSDLSAMLHRGDLDLALASSVLALDTPPLSMWMEGPVIASDGPIHSVLLFLAPGVEKPEAIRRWFADPFSRTGRRLTQWLMHHAWKNAEAELLEVPQDMDAFEAAIELGVDAVQLIGDPALLAVPANPDWTIIDLGSAWKATAKKPFVFAGWMMRDGFELGKLAEVLENAAENGLGKRQEFARESAAGDDVRQAFLTRYLCEDLRYRLSANEVRDCLAEFRVS